MRGWPSGGYRPAEGDGLAHLGRQRLGELCVRLSAEWVVDCRERQAEGSENGDGENLVVVEAGVAELLDVGGRRRVRVLDDLSGPRCHGLLLVRQRGVAAVQNPRGQRGLGGCGQVPAPCQRAVRGTEGRGGG